MSLVRSVLALLLAVIAATACDSSSPEPSPTPRPSPIESSPAEVVHAPAPGLLYQGDWVLVSGAAPDGTIPLDPEYPITLEMNALRGGGRSTCNSYGGRFKIDGTAFYQRTLGAEQAGCASKTLETAELRYLEALTAVREIEADETTLRLTGPGAELVFERIPEVDLDAVVDTTWVSGDHTLRLSSNRTYRVTYGCRVLEGTWRVMAGRIYMPEGGVTKDCPNPGGDAVAVDVTSGDFTVAVGGGRLTITHGGKSVVYRRRR